MNSSDTSAKYSWPRSEQKDEIHDSGVPDEVDIFFPICPELSLSFYFPLRSQATGSCSVGVMVEMGR